MEKKYDKDKGNKVHKGDNGEMGIGMIMLLLIVGCFVLWVLTGGPTKKDTTKPYIKPYTDPTNPGETYGPTLK